MLAVMCDKHIAMHFKFQLMRFTNDRCVMVVGHVGRNRLIYTELNAIISGKNG
jgi:hypothetical protein